MREKSCDQGEEKKIFGKGISKIDAAQFVFSQPTAKLSMPNL